MSPVGPQAKLEAATEKFVRSKELLKAAKMQEQHGGAWDDQWDGIMTGL